jgi:hypothetical protein
MSFIFPHLVNFACSWRAGVGMIDFVQIGKFHGIKDPKSCVILGHAFHSIKLHFPREIGGCLQ